MYYVKSYYIYLSFGDKAALNKISWRPRSAGCIETYLLDKTNISLQKFRLKTGNIIIKTIFSRHKAFTIGMMRHTFSWSFYKLSF
jgi:hypothetical protein